MVRYIIVGHPEKNNELDVGAKMVQTLEAHFGRPIVRAFISLASLNDWL